MLDTTSNKFDPMLYVISNKYDVANVLDERYRSIIEKCFDGNYTLESVSQLVQNIKSKDIILWHQGLIGIRKIVSAVQNPNIQAIIDTGIIPKIFEFTKYIDFPQLEVQATWILVNLCSETTQHCQVVVKQGGINLFIQLLQSQNPYVVYNAVWGIGNLVNDSPKFRDEFIKLNVLQTLIQITEKYKENEFLLHCCWVASSIVRVKPLPNYSQVKGAFLIIYKALMLAQFKDQNTLIDCLQAISFFSFNQDQIKVLKQMNLFPLLLKHCEAQFIEVLMPAIDIVGNIASGEDEDSQKLIQAGVMPVFEKLLNHQKKVIRRQACRTLFNLSVSNQIIISQQSIIDKLLKIFSHDEFDVRKEVCFIFSDLLNRAEPSSIYYLCETKKLMKCYIDFLSSQDQYENNVDLFRNILITIKKLINQGQQNKINGKNIFLSELVKYKIQNPLFIMQDYVFFANVVLELQQKINSLQV